MILVEDHGFFSTLMRPLATFLRLACFSGGYTCKNMKPAQLMLLLVMTAASGLSADTSFRTVRMPNAKGKQIKAVLTFHDNDKTVEVRPAKGASVTVPYAEIEKCSYAYTAERTIAMTPAKTHWLEMDYHDQDAHRALILRMGKKDYLRILDAVKVHTGIEVELLGNADKRHESIWRTR